MYSNEIKRKTGVLFNSFAIPSQWDNNVCICKQTDRQIWISMADNGSPYMFEQKWDTDNDRYIRRSPQPKSEWIEYENRTWDSHQPVGWSIATNKNNLAVCKQFVSPQKTIITESIFPSRPFPIKSEHFMVGNGFYFYSPIEILKRKNDVAESKHKVFFGRDHKDITGGGYQPTLEMTIQSHRNRQNM